MCVLLRIRCFLISASSLFDAAMENSETFLFTSESVGEGHPGKPLVFVIDFRMVAAIFYLLSSLFIVDLKLIIMLLLVYVDFFFLTISNLFFSFQYFPLSIIKLEHTRGF